MKKSTPTLALSAALLVLLAIGPAFGREDETPVTLAGALAEPPAQTPAGKATIDRVAGFFRRVGLDGHADRLEKDFAHGRVVFDPRVRKEDASTGAYVDPATMRMHVDAAQVSEREVGVGGRTNTINLAATIYHEYIHVDQGQEFLKSHGDSDRETPAWSNQLQMTASWIKDRRSALDRATTDADRVEILRDLAGARAAHAGVVAGIGENIALGNVARPDLTPERLAELLRAHNREAAEAILPFEKMLEDPAFMRKNGSFHNELIVAHEQIPDWKGRMHLTGAVTGLKGATASTAATTSDTGSVSIDSMKPVKVIARGRQTKADLPQGLRTGEVRNYTLTFWNVGAQVPGHEGATYTEHLVGGKKQWSPHSFPGTFSGGPNGDFYFPKGLPLTDDSSGNRPKLVDGKTIRVNGLQMTIENPGAFAGWPAEAK